MRRTSAAAVTRYLRSTAVGDRAGVGPGKGIRVLGGDVITVWTDHRILVRETLESGGFAVATAPSHLRVVGRR